MIQPPSLSGLSLAAHSSTLSMYWYGSVGLRSRLKRRPGTVQERPEASWTWLSGWAEGPLVGLGPSWFTSPSADRASTTFGGWAISFGPVMTHASPGLSEVVRSGSPGVSAAWAGSADRASGTADRV
ncbi:hypothetical protein [Streptomyces sp. NPDC002215]|uniref:hypothetical protein n=1 Tax=Streptomyces sp. NPDC002215 TaxID=3154412 RepID=UPI00332CB5B2